MAKSRIPPVNREHVLAALRDFEGGQPHGFGKSTKYDLVHDGRRYPPKAILALAVRRATGQQLGPADFSGGDDSTCFKRLRTAGFTVARKQTPGSERRPDDWTEVECYFAVWGYDQLDLDRDLEKKSLYVELSELLGRTPKSVEFKIQNVSACDPRERSEKPISTAPHTQRLLKQAFDEYWQDRRAARAREPEMRECLKFISNSGPATRNQTPRLNMRIVVEEGATSVMHVRMRERSRLLLRDGRQHFRQQDPEGKLRCAACGYVSPTGLGDDTEIVQLHHTDQLAELDERGRRLELGAALQRMIPLCPNCHAVAHTRRPPLDLPVIQHFVRRTTPAPPPPVP